MSNARAAFEVMGFPQPAQDWSDPPEEGALLGGGIVGFVAADEGGDEGRFGGIIVAPQVEQNFAVGVRVVPHSSQNLLPPVLLDGGAREGTGALTVEAGRTGAVEGVYVVAPSLVAIKERFLAPFCEASLIAS